MLVAIYPPRIFGNWHPSPASTIASPNGESAIRRPRRQTFQLFQPKWWRLPKPLKVFNNRAGLLKAAQTLYTNTEIQRGVCVMLIDIDHFKRINDTRGHDAGDRIINGVVQVLRQAVRTGDHVGRWGGEEFVILCAGTTRQGAENLAERIRVSVADGVFERDVRPLRITISIGVAMTKSGESFEMTLKNADELLYKAKESGRNCVVIES